jgi:hypothetical protein
MPKFNPGDEATVDGRQVTIESWPHNDTGPYVATYINGQGGKVFMNLHTGTHNPEGQTHEDVDAVLVKKAKRAPKSTAGSLPSLDGDE